MTDVYRALQAHQNDRFVLVLDETFAAAPLCSVLDIHLVSFNSCMIPVEGREGTGSLSLVKVIYWWNGLPTNIEILTIVQILLDYYSDHD